MLGSLTPDEIENVLRSEVLGRVGFVDAGSPYIVPLTYVYDAENGHVYAHATEGMKVRAMRAMPRVCFEVEQVRDMANWRSVVAVGEYEELGRDNQAYGMELLARRFASAPPGIVLTPRREEQHKLGGVIRSVLFRIRLLDKTGRYEST